MKFSIYTGAGLGGLLGGYIPTLWHAGIFSAWGLIGGLIGTGLGIWAGYKVGQNFDL